MKKANRIKDNDDFSLIIKTGHFKKNDTYRIYWKVSDLGYTRVGLAVSKKIGNAVVRSTTRRKLRAICDLLIDYQNNSFDLIVVPKNLFLNQDYVTNRDKLNEIFEQFIRTKK